MVMLKGCACFVLAVLMAAAFGVRAQSASDETSRAMELQARQVQALKMEHAMNLATVAAMEREHQSIRPLANALLLARTDAERRVLLDKMAVINPELAEEFRVALNMSATPP